MVAAAAWAAVEPGVARLVRAPVGYSDVRLLGAPLTGGGGRWREVGLAAHLANGAVFGTLFAAAGCRGWKQGLAVAQAESLALWPAMAAVDRIHPDRRDGTWPPLVRNGRVFVHEAAMHAVFGIVLGLLVRD
jgi:hypothetical protein